MELIPVNSPLISVAKWNLDVVVIEADGIDA